MSGHLSLSLNEIYFFPQDSGVDPSYGLGELLISLCHNPTDHKLTVKILSARRLQPFPNGRMSEYTIIIFLNSITQIFSSQLWQIDCVLKFTQLWSSSLQGELMLPRPWNSLIFFVVSYIQILLSSLTSHFAEGSLAVVQPKLCNTHWRPTSARCLYLTYTLTNCLKSRLFSKSSIAGNCGTLP